MGQPCPISNRCNMTDTDTIDISHFTAASVFEIMIEKGWNPKIVCDELHAHPTFQDALDCDQSVWWNIRVDVSKNLRGVLDLSKSWDLDEFVQSPMEHLALLDETDHQFG